MMTMMTRHLDLDDAQSVAIENVINAAKPEIDALRERGKASRDAMRSLDVDSPDYGTSLQNLSSEVGSVTSAATLLMGRLRADIYAELTAEQREQASAGRQGMREHFRRHKPGV
jgi:Spy/CpxP family protein refolding chaperone